MSVYFIVASASPTMEWVKIGFTTGCPRARAQSLQTGSPLKLNLLWSGAGDETDERRIHRCFEYCRVHGEWFEFGGGIKQFIDVARNHCCLRCLIHRWEAENAEALAKALRILSRQ